MEFYFWPLRVWIISKSWEVDGARKNCRRIVKIYCICNGDGEPLHNTKPNKNGNWERQKKKRINSRNHKDSIKYVRSQNYIWYLMTLVWIIKSAFYLPLWLTEWNEDMVHSVGIIPFSELSDFVSLFISHTLWYIHVYRVARRKTKSQHPHWLWCHWCAWLNLCAQRQLACQGTV